MRLLSTLALAAWTFAVLLLIAQHRISSYIVRRNELGDACENPDTGRSPCLFCRRSVPCECAGEACMCDCGRCMPGVAPQGAPPPPTPGVRWIGRARP